jgi:large subunit ribosomal protein L33
MAKGKLKSVFVKLMSGAGTGFFYVTRKNPKNVPEKLTLRKYDPVVVRLFFTVPRPPPRAARCTHARRCTRARAQTHVRHACLLPPDAASAPERAAPTPAPAHVLGRGSASTCSSQRPKSSSEPAPRCARSVPARGGSRAASSHACCAGVVWWRRECPRGPNRVWRAAQGAGAHGGPHDDPRGARPLFRDIEFALHLFQVPQREKHIHQGSRPRAHRA